MQMCNDIKLSPQKEQTGVKVIKTEPISSFNCEIKKEFDSSEESAADKPEEVINKLSKSAEANVVKAAQGAEVGVSRRRLFFKSRSVTASAANQTQNPSTKVGETVVATTDTPSSSAPSSQLASTPTRVQRKWEHWNPVDVKNFYEGLKQYGKDFEQISKFMVKKKCEKDKDQIRNYYFNSLKVYKAAGRIDEEKLLDIPKEARELFIMINGLEWRRRLWNRIDPTKLKQLVFEGMASHRVRRKKQKQLIMMKTPICPALQRYFHYSKPEAPLPSHLLIILSPKTEADRAYVESCGQCAWVRVKIAIGDQISRLFSFLKAKWMPFSFKRDHRMACVEKKSLNVTLYPDETTKLSKPRVNLGEVTPVVFSVNKLKWERARLNAERAAKKNKELLPAGDVSKMGQYGEKPLVAETEASIFDTKDSCSHIVKRLNSCKKKSFVAQRGLESVLQASNGLTQCEKNLEDMKNSGMQLSQVINNHCVQNPTLSPPEDAKEPSNAEHVFGIAESSLIAGLTQETVGESTVVELYYLCSKQKEIKLLYSTGYREDKCFDAWKVFVGLINRNYGENLCKVSEMNLDARKNHRLTEELVRKRTASTCTRNASPVVLSKKPMISQSPTKACINSKDVVQEENSAFLQQLHSLGMASRREKKWRRSSNVTVRSTSQQRKVSEAPCFVMSSVQNFNRNKNKRMLVSVPSTSKEGSNIFQCRTETTQSSLISNEMTRVVSNETVFPNGKMLTELSNMAPNQTPSFFISPTKDSTLPDDVKHQMELMLQQNSVDFCQSFRDLISYNDPNQSDISLLSPSKSQSLETIVFRSQQRPTEDALQNYAQHY